MNRSLLSRAGVEAELNLCRSATVTYQEVKASTEMLARNDTFLRSEVRRLTAELDDFKVLAQANKMDAKRWYDKYNQEKG